jgi:CBS domain-containing protein
MFRDEWKEPISPEDSAWLDKYDAKERETVRIKQERAARAAKKLGKPVGLVTSKDIEKAAAPAKPKGRAKANPGRDAELVEVAGMLEAQKEARDPRSLLFARALAMAAMSRNLSNAHSVRKQIKIGKAYWVVATYSRNKKHVPVPYGQDSLVLMALTTLMIDNHSSLLSFETISTFLKELEKAGIDVSGGKGRERINERLTRLRNCSLNISFYSSEEDASLERNDIKTIQCVIVRDYQIFTKDDEEHEDQGQIPLFPYYIELSDDYRAHVEVKKNQLWLPYDLLKLFAPHPLKLQVLFVAYARSLAAQSPWTMYHDELMTEFLEGNKSERLLMSDIQDALREIKKATGNQLSVEIVEDGLIRSGQGGRPKKRWRMQGKPCQAITAMHLKTLKG